MKLNSKGNRDVFDDQEVEHLHAEDLQAGRIVVGIMTGVFVMGLVLYSFIWLLVR